MGFIPNIVRSKKIKELSTLISYEGAIIYVYAPDSKVFGLLST